MSNIIKNDSLENKLQDFSQHKINLDNLNKLYNI